VPLVQLARKAPLALLARQALQVQPVLLARLRKAQMQKRLAKIRQPRVPARKQLEPGRRPSAAVRLRKVSALMPTRIPQRQWATTPMRPVPMLSR
jgi:hypothetical protein